MTGTKRNWRAVSCVSAALLVAMCGTSHAQSEKSGAPVDDAVLKGPSVKDNSVPGQRGKFTSGQGKGKEREQVLTPRVMMQAMGVLKQESTPAEARLTEEQERRIKAVQDDFRTTQREFLVANRAEIMDLRSKLGPENRRKVDERLRALPGFAGGPADKALGRPEGKPGKGKGKGEPGKGEPEAMDDGDGTMMTDAASAEQDSAMNRLKEIAQTIPDPKDAQTKAWAVLSDSQKAIVEKELVRMRKEAAARRGEAGKGSPASADAPGRDAMPMLPPGAIRADGTVDMSKLPPKIRERLENLPADEREKAIKRLVERSRQGAMDGAAAPPARRPGKGAPAAGGDGGKAPPPMDEVEVPKPQDDASPR